jgi:hypothetical protein
MLEYYNGIRPHINLKYVPIFLNNKPIPDTYLQIGQYKENDYNWYPYLLQNEKFIFIRRLEDKLHKNGTLSWFDWDLIPVICENKVYLDIGSVHFTDYKQYFDRKILDRIGKASEKMQKKRAIQAVVDNYLNEDIGTILNKFTSEKYSEFWTRNYF